VGGAAILSRPRAIVAWGTTAAVAASAVEGAVAFFFKRFGDDVAWMGGGRSGAHVIAAFEAVFSWFAAGSGMTVMIVDTLVVDCIVLSPVISPTEGAEGGASKTNAATAFSGTRGVFDFPRSTMPGGGPWLCDTALMCCVVSDRATPVIPRDVSVPTAPPPTSLVDDDPLLSEAEILLAASAAAARWGRCLSLILAGGGEAVFC
jgi:hypothetical protein